MSKKPRPRRPAATAAASAQPSGDLLDTMPDLWKALAAGELLEAEIETATALAVPRIAGRMDDAQADKFIAEAMVPAAVSRRTPDAAAFLRLLTSLGAPVVKRAASSALAQLTGAGVYPLEWVNQAGQAEPRGAWRLWDVFGDHEWIVVSFGYGDSEHAVIAQVQRAVLPRVSNVAVTTDIERTITTLRDNAQAYERFDEIGPAEARRRLEDPLRRADGEGDAQTTLRMYWPLAMSRVRRLPEDDLAQPTTDDDRAASVDEFLASEQHAAGLEQDAARFWAQILTAYTARTPGEPPTAVGPHMLPVILLGHVPAYFTLTPEQRESMEPAVTGWLTWSARQRGVDPERLMIALKETLASFGEAYDDPDNVLSRQYVADTAVPTANPVKLAEIRLRRLFAVPDQPPRGPGFDPADPASRRADAQEEFGGCEPPAGMTSDQLVTAVTRVLDELWSGEPARTWDRARALVAQGASRHDTLHSLVKPPS